MHAGDDTGPVTTPPHEMTASDAAAILGEFDAAGVDVVVGGGWAVDANVGSQSRPHGDLDVWLPVAQFDAALRAFVAAGVDRLYPWGNDRPWNFVLHDGGRRRIDLHVHEGAGSGQLHYGGLDGETFPAAALQGHGTIDGTPVRCETPEWSLRWHTGYPARDIDHHDVALLAATFSIDLPEQYRR